MANYLVQSERMQAFLRTAGLVGQGSLFVAATVWLVIFVTLNGTLPRDFRQGRLLVVSVAVTWIALVILGSAIIARSRPYGLRILQVFTLVLACGLLPDIRDYNRSRIAGASIG